MDSDLGMDADAGGEGVRGKIGAIARYEVLMAWRRGSLPILGGLLLILITALGLVSAQSNQRSIVYVDPVMQAAIARGLDADAVRTTLSLMTLLALLDIVFGVALTLFLTETIPLDRQFKVRELVDTLPISRTVYLGGKLLGAGIGITLIIAITAGVSLVTLRLIIGVFDGRVVLLLWLVAVLPFCWVCCTLSVLATAFLGSRRQAMILGLLLLPLDFLVWAATISTLLRVAGLIDPIYLYEFGLTTPELETPLKIGAEAVGLLALMAGMGAVVWGLAWAGERWREGR